MFTKADPDGYLEPVPGVRFRTLVHGERTLVAEFRVTAGQKVARHAHPHEQTGYLVSGHIVVTIGSEVFEARQGDSWCIPGGVEHEARVLEDAVAIEVFSPVMEDYLPETD